MSMFSDRISNVLVEKRLALLIAVLVLTAAGAYFMKYLQVENSIEVWFLKDDPALVDYLQFKKLYGNDEVIIIWMRPDKGIYDPAFIKRVYGISERIGAHPLVNRVMSITTVPYAENKGDSLKIEPVVSKEPDSSFNVEEFRKRLNSNAILAMNLFNKANDATIVSIEPKADPEIDAKRPELIKFVKRNCEGLDYRLIGGGVIYDELNRLTILDAGIFTSLTYVLLLASIFMFYRKRSIMIATTATIVIITVLVLGVLGLLRQKLNMVSAILPSLVLIMCLEDIIFIYSHYYDTPPPERDIVKTLSHVMVPCFFTSLTTALGFFSFFVSPMKILKYFGLFAALSVMLEYVVSVIVGTYVLAFIEGRQKKAEAGPGTGARTYETLFRPWLSRLSGIVQLYYWQITLIFVIVLGAGVYGITMINVDTLTIGMLLRSNPVRQDSEFFEKDYGYYVPLEARLMPASGTIKDPAFLNGLSRVQERFDSEYGYKSVSVADAVKELNKVFTDGRQESYRIPDRADAIAQELLMYEMDGKGDLFYLTNSAMSEARLTVRIPMASSQTFKRSKDIVQKVVRDEFGGGVKLQFGGYGPLYIKLIDYISQTQIESFILAFALIFLSTTILLRSAYYLFIIVIPNVIPIIFTLGFMGYSGINLDVATVTVAAITIGLSVDNTIHYLYYFKMLRARGVDVRDAVGEALMFKGAPMFISNIILVFGYLIMVFGHVTSVIYFGLLVSLTLVMALFCDLLLLPSLLILFSRGGKEKASAGAL